MLRSFNTKPHVGYWKLVWKMLTHLQLMLQYLDMNFTQLLTNSQLQLYKNDETDFSVCFVSVPSFWDCRPEKDLFLQLDEIFENNR